VDDLKNLGGFLRFVGLQMADKVVAGVGPIGQFSPLGLELLHVVFAEVAQPERIGVANRLGGKFLGNRDQLDVRPVPSNARRRRQNAGFHLI
jgi:hypothetical protein